MTAVAKTELKSSKMETVIVLLILLVSVVPMIWAMMQLFTADASCPTEDSVSCCWDATVQGNGEGTSFCVDEDGQLIP